MDEKHVTISLAVTIGGKNENSTSFDHSAHLGGMLMSGRAREQFRTRETPCRDQCINVGPDPD